MAALPSRDKSLQRRHRWYDQVLELQSRGKLKLDRRQRYVQWVSDWFAQQAQWTEQDTALFFPITGDDCPNEHRVMIPAHLLYIQRSKDEIWHRMQYISNSLSDAQISPFECVAEDECERALLELELLIQQFWQSVVTGRELFGPPIAQVAHFEASVLWKAGTDWLEYLIRADNHLRTGVRLEIFGFSWWMKVALIIKSVLPATMIVLIVALLDIWNKFTRTPMEYGDESIAPKIINNAIVIGGLVVLLFATTIPPAYYDVKKKERLYNIILADFYRLQAMLLNIACRSQLMTVYHLQRGDVQHAKSTDDVVMDFKPIA